MNTKLLRKILSCFLCVFSLFQLLKNGAHGAQSISYNGITWTFSEDCPTGTFANGEPWVLGPVTITKIDPPSIVTNERLPRLTDGEGPHVQNGSMVNPVPNGNHGFTTMNDWNLAPEKRYKESLNVARALPKTLVSGDVLVSSKTWNDHFIYNYIEVVTALTVLSNTPPPNSFRPGPYGKDRTVEWSTNNINWSLLPNLPKVTESPSLASIRELLPALPWWEWSSEYSGGGIIPGRNIFTGYDQNGSISNYGREIAAKWSKIGCYLVLDSPKVDRDPLVIQTIQCGIDIHSYVINGGGFEADGGHKCGRKFPVVFAAILLNDSKLLEFARNQTIFQEDQQTFIVQSSDVGRQVDPPSETYAQEHVGLGEWGIRHLHQPNKDDSRFFGGTPYRHIVWPAMAGSVLAIDLMGKKDAWGHPAIFMFNERYNSKSPYTGFIGNMWKRYKPIVSRPRNLKLGSSRN